MANKTLRSIMLLCSMLPFAFNLLAQTNSARFESFEYKGKDNRFMKRMDPRKEYFNPIISGFYSDPSICRKGDDYYMVHSTFAYYPGIPIFHSKDLVNWKQIGFVLNRTSQLRLDGIRLSGGIYAPAIEYNKHNDTFYVITTCVDGIGNFVVKTQDPTLNDWSEPIRLPRVDGIDPSLFFDDDGKAYIVHNGAPQGTPKWDGHRAIWMHEYDVETDRTVGTPHVILDGGINPAAKPVWIEGPHIYKVNGKYYLMAAEGGTSVNHSEVILGAPNVKGPYRPAQSNPILTQRNLSPSRYDIVTSVGHADLIDTPEGDWYAVFLGCRPYEGNHYNIGRETYLLPVTWENDFPIILRRGLTLPTIVEKANLKPDVDMLMGNFIWRDNFMSQTLNYAWQMIRSPKGYYNWWSLNYGSIILDAMPTSIYEVDHPAFLGRRQQHTSFEVQVKMDFKPSKDQELAGLVCYQNETHNIVFGRMMRNGRHYLVVTRAEKIAKQVGIIPIPPEYVNSPILLRIDGDADKYSFYASFNEGVQWFAVAEGVDAKNLSTETAGGFVGTMIGMYATSKKDFIPKRTTTP